MAITHIITGVWYSNGETSRHISHVMLHRLTTPTLVAQGEKVTKSFAILLIKELHKNNNFICTAKWNYSSVLWNWNPNVHVWYEIVNNVEYLRANPDNTESDNLTHLINLSAFNIQG